MNTTSHDFVTVDMRGLKAALVARAQAERVGVSAVVRRAVERELQVVAMPSRLDGAAGIATPGGPIVKLSIRLTRSETEVLDARARSAGLSRGAFLAGLLAGVPSLSGGSASRLDCLASLNASCAELSTLSRNVHQLTTLLRQGEVRQAREYRRKLDILDAEVRAHLSTAASVLAELRPARQVRVAALARSHAAS